MHEHYTMRSGQTLRRHGDSQEVEVWFGNSLEVWPATVPTESLAAALDEILYLAEQVSRLTEQTSALSAENRAKLQEIVDKEAEIETLRMERDAARSVADALRRQLLDDRRLDSVTIGGLLHQDRELLLLLDRAKAILVPHMRLEALLPEDLERVQNILKEREALHREAAGGV